MNHSSVSKKISTTVFISVLAGALTVAFVLYQFYSYTVRTKTVMNGDHKTVILGQMLEARVSAVISLAEVSVSSKSENKKFNSSVETFTKDIDLLKEEFQSPHLRKSHKIATEILNESNKDGKTIEDLFVYHRNVKTIAFQIYKDAWRNKWMTIASIMGLVINDLDNTPYHTGSRLAASVFPKIAKLTAVITNSALPQREKIGLFTDLKNLKKRITRYTDAVVAADELKNQRKAKLASLAKELSLFNKSQGKNLTMFGEVEHSRFLISSSVSLAFLVLALFWYLLNTRRFAGHFKKVSTHLVHELNEWVGSSGNINSTSFEMPKKVDTEFVELYKTIDKTIQTVNIARKEDLLVKRLLHVPFMLVNRNKVASYWNSSLAHLIKIRMNEDVGGVQYRNVLRFSDVRGKPIDPIEKCFQDRKEITQLALMKVGDENIATQIICTAVIDSDHQVEYVLVHVRDLREENRRAEIELDRQLESVREALVSLNKGKIPIDSPEWVRRPVIECIHSVKTYMLEKQEKDSVVAGQVQTVWGRVQREAQLKKAIFKRTEQVRSEINEMGNQVELLFNSVEHLAQYLEKFEIKITHLVKKHREIKSQGSKLEDDLKNSRVRLDSCITWLEKAEDLTKYIRSHERIVKSLVDKSAVQNANSSIFGAKIKNQSKELTPADIIGVTENLNHLTDIFQRSSGFISRSVNEIERGFREIADKLQSEIKSCKSIVSNDKNLMKTLQKTDQLVDAGHEDIENLLNELRSLKQSAKLMSEQFTGMESKANHLIQISQASMSLQDQLSMGMKGMYDQFSSGSDVAEIQAELVEEPTVLA